MPLSQNKNKFSEEPVLTQKFSKVFKTINNPNINIHTIKLLKNLEKKLLAHLLLYVTSRR